MRKKILVLVLAVGVILGCTGCGNKDMWDTVYTYDKAIISLPNGGTVEGQVQSWTDYEDGDQLQIKIDGKTYLVHSEDCALITE